MIELHIGGLPPEKVPLLGPLIADAMETTTPDRAQALLSGFIANIVGNISPEFFEAMRKASYKPCSQPGCKCHECHSQCFEALAILRKEWDRVTSEKDSNPDEKGFSE